MLDGSNPTGLWIGQDVHDYVGPSVVAGPSGVQDVRIHLTNLPEGRTVTSAQVGGYGGGLWAWNMAPAAGWAAEFQTDGQGAADVFFEPYQVETGRLFTVTLLYDDSSTDEVWLNGGAADPGTRMPAATLQVEWVGQDGTDAVGLGPAVGPDGIQDVRLRLSNLSPETAIASVDVRGPDGLEWRSGVNPTARSSAQFSRDPSDPTRGDLLLGTDRNLAGLELTVEVVYATRVIDQEPVTAGTVNPSLGMPVPSAPTVVTGVSAIWAGQDGLDLGGQEGAVHLALDGLPSDRRVVAAVVTGGSAVAWVSRMAGSEGVYADEWARALAFVRSGPTTADLGFVPVRDETGATVTVRLVFDDGSEALATTPGGPVDLDLRSPGPAETSIVAQPGDDLQNLVRQFGTVHLAPGVYELSEPLVLDSPVSLLGQPGAELRFHQAANDAAWATAIEVRAARTMLDGFSVRFEGPVRWDWDVSYGAAVIGSIDTRKAAAAGDLYDLVFTHLDIESSPAVTAGVWEASPLLFRLENAQNGRIDDNTLVGGMTVVRGGPWSFSRNDYRGTAAFTTADAVFSGLSTHDVTIADNHAQAATGAGKTWRFTVLTQSGVNDRIVGNQSIGIGPQDDDAIPNPNAAEQILTEAYRLRFEGRPQAIRQSGQLVQIPTPQGDAVRTGDILAILNGPNAGQWRRVVQVIDARTFWVDEPLPDGTDQAAISVGPAFLNLAVADNLIDTRGSSLAANLYLVGAQFGTRVTGNTLLGGNHGLLIAASSTEAPLTWGWSHTPVFDLLVEANTVEGSRSGSLIEVEHTASTQSSKGRTYLTGIVTRNAFGAVSSQTGQTPALTIGSYGTLDPDELWLEVLQNVALDSSATAQVIAGRINGQLLTGTALSLAPASPPAPTGVRLVNNTGASHSDGVTSDAAIRFEGDSSAARYEYRLGDSEAYRPITASAEGFVPADLVDGLVIVFIRPIGWAGHPGAEASVSFVLDRDAPTTIAPRLDSTTDSGVSSSDRLTASRRPVFWVEADPDTLVQLVRDGVTVATAQGSGLLVDETNPPDGIYRYQVLRTDPAGNSSASDWTTIEIDTTGPGPVEGLVADRGVITFVPSGPSDRYEASVDGGAFVAVADPAAWTSTALTPGAHRVSVRAVDAAGNVGPESILSVLVPPPDPMVVWLGQDGVDVTTLGTARRDGLLDAHIRLEGLAADRSVVAVIVSDTGGAQWSAGPWTGRWDAVFVRKPGSSSADLYVQPYRATDAGEVFRVELRYDDGSTSNVTVEAGSLDPTRRTRIVSVPALRNVLSNGRIPTTISKTRIVPGSGLAAALQTWKRQQQMLVQLRRARKR
jgi:hypothetical protein